MANESNKLLRVYKISTPEQLAETFRSYPELTRSGLEKLLENDADAFSKAVPQAVDQQTGLFSKSHFENVLLPNAIKNAENNGDPLSYVLLDFDNFHDFNDQYSHTTGDAAIKSFANLLKSSFRISGDRRTSQIDTQDNKRTEDRRSAPSLDYVARLPEKYSHQGRVGYGEEFALVLYGCDGQTSLRSIKGFLDKVRKLEIPHENKKVGITVSGGIAVYKKGMGKAQLIAEADAALKYIKNNSKNDVALYSQIPKRFIPPNPSG